MNCSRRPIICKTALLAQHGDIPHPLQLTRIFMSKCRLPRGAYELAICGSITLHPRIAHGGPLVYTLQRTGPLLSYSPMYYKTRNGFLFFNNAIFTNQAPVLDASGSLITTPWVDVNGLIFTASVSNGGYELNVIASPPGTPARRFGC
jgi:hypothetical protein